jgi:hypothetical protein
MPPATALQKRIAIAPGVFRGFGKTDPVQSVRPVWLLENVVPLLIELQVGQF